MEIDFWIVKKKKTTKFGIKNFFNKNYEGNFLNSNENSVTDNFSTISKVAFVLTERHSFVFIEKCFFSFSRLRIQIISVGKKCDATLRFLPRIKKKNFCTRINLTNDGKWKISKIRLSNIDKLFDLISFKQFISLSRMIIHVQDNPQCIRSTSSVRLKSVYLLSQFIQHFRFSLFSFFQRQTNRIVWFHSCELTYGPCAHNFLFHV